MGDAIRDKKEGKICLQSSSPYPFPILLSPFSPWPFFCFLPTPFPSRPSPFLFPLVFSPFPFPFSPSQSKFQRSVYLKSSHNAEHLPDLCRPNALGCQRPASRKKVFLSDFKDAKHLIIILPHISFLAQTFLFLLKSYHNSLIIAVHMLS